MLAGAELSSVGVVVLVAAFLVHGFAMFFMPLGARFMGGFGSHFGGAACHSEQRVHG
jgi:hypothetical protein